MSWTVYVTRQRCEGNRGTAPLVLKVGARRSGQLYPMVALICGRNSPISGRVYPEPNWTLWNRKLLIYTDFVFCIFLYSVLRPYLCLCLDCPAFLPFVFIYNTTQTSMPPAGFEPATPASDPLDRSATGMGNLLWLLVHIVT